MAKQLLETTSNQANIIQQLEHAGEDVTDVRIFLNKKTLRMTRQGFAILSKHFKSWASELEQPFTSGELVIMLRTVTSPYYIQKSKIILFNEEDAFMCKLAGTKGWVHSK